MILRLKGFVKSKAPQSAISLSYLIFNMNQKFYALYALKRISRIELSIGLDVAAGAMAKPDDATGHAAHFGGYLSGHAEESPKKLYKT